MNKFSIREAFNFGFRVARNNILFYLGIFVISIIISGLNNSLQASFEKQYFFVFVIGLIFWIISEIIGMGILRINLKFVDQIKPGYKDLFILNWKALLNYILVSILAGLIVVVGFIMLIIPGIIFGLKLQYATYLVVDKNIGPIEAIKTSWKMTKSNVWHLFVLALAIIGVNILGVLVFIIGLLITIPLSMVAQAFVFRKLSA